MANELSYGAEAAAEYDRAYSHVSAHFLPFLLRATRLATGQRVLDVATGTGIAAEAALGVVGSAGSVVATDISLEMVEKARERIASWSNAAVSVEDGQELSFPEQSFDAVICSLGLMFFPDPEAAVAGFRRVLRSGGWAAISVLTAPERSYNGRINVVMARHVPELAQATARTFALGDARLRLLFATAGFRDIETGTEKHRFVLPSFNSYFGPFERGGAPLVRRWPLCLRPRGALCGRKCAERWAIRVGPWRSMSRSGLRVADARSIQASNTMGAAPELPDSSV
jgi:ubiquinone/menaquinone biosynthesis C-methylase UbiE